MHVLLLAIACLFAVVFVKSSSVSQNGFELSIIHFNDFHARFEPINKYAATCKKKEANCVGGFARMYSAIMNLKKQKPNAIVLNAGDNFQGSLWYTYFKWRAIVHFINKLPIDVHTIGNHEFDDEIEGLIPLLRNLDAPVVVSNIDDSQEPQLQNMYKKRIVIEKLGRRIGVIGAIVTNTPESSRPGKLKFLNEIESINKEANKLVAEDNIDTIIVLSHCGYFDDLEIARNAAPKIGLIVGGHSHLLLYNGIPPDNLTTYGPYPTVVRHKDGRNIPVVQASAFTRFVGEITIRYDNHGGAVSWTGAPIYLNENVLPDPVINKEIQEWQKKIDDYGTTKIGINLLVLDHSNCYDFECNIGDFIADAMLYAYSNTTVQNSRKPVSIALINAGGIRNPINVGEITVGDLVETMPYDNTFDLGELQGKYIKEALEHAALLFYGSRNLLQLSGLNVLYNITKPPGSRVERVQVSCKECPGVQYEDLDMEKFYRIVTNTFLAQGGDGFSEISANLVNYVSGILDRDVVQQYIIYKSPIKQSVDGRIRFIE